jgi:heat shock protein HslJ
MWLPALMLAWAIGAPAAAMAQQAPVEAPQEPVAPPRVGDKLIGTKWQAKTLEGRPADAAGATIDFLPDDQVRGQAGCKRFVGPFGSRADRITIGPVRTTRATCTGEEAEQERQMLEVLRQAARVVLEEDAMLLYGGAGEPSRFVPRPD